MRSRLVNLFRLSAALAVFVLTVGNLNIVSIAQTHANVTAIAVGGAMLALKSDGTVWAWGGNDHGELGIGSSTGPNICLVGLTGQEARHACSTSPVQVTGLSNVIAIAAGDSHSLALKKDGTIWAWGSNRFGELGIGDNTGPDQCSDVVFGGAHPCSLTPVQVLGLSNVKAIAAGFFNNSLALKSDGTVWVWGINVFGQLGTGPTGPDKCGGNACSRIPVQVKNLDSITALAGGGHRVLALRTDGTVWAWGSAILGNGTRSDSVTPVEVSGLSNVTAIAAGQLDSLALKDDGTVWAWGNNPFGQLGIGNPTGPDHCSGLGDPSCSLTPVQVEDLSSVAAIASQLALTKDGTVWVWGFNYCGSLGNGNNTGPEQCGGYPCSRIPLQISGLSGVRAIASGGCNGLALHSDGTVWAWGANEVSELGIGAADRRYHTPVQVQGL